MTPERMAEIHAASFVAQRAWSRDEIVALLEMPTTLQVAVGENAFALCQAIAGEAEVLTIAVHPDLQRQGLGQSCLSALIDAAETRKIENIFLEVSEENSAAIGLYKRAGFQITGRRKAYYKLADGTKRDAILMGKDLTNGSPSP